MSALEPCTLCARHVRRTESVCPFCGASLAWLREAPRMLRERLGRSALFAFGAAATAASVAGCSAGACAAYSDTGDPAADASAVDAASTDSGAIDAAAGDAPTAPDAGVDGGGIMPPYGAPPDDSGDQDGGPGNLYGAPPP